MMCFGMTNVQRLAGVYKTNNRAFYDAESIPAKL